jgi:ribose transport system ATP-binding protein
VSKWHDHFGLTNSHLLPRNRMSDPAPHADPALLVMRRVTKRFLNVVALANVDFDVRRGEVHAICGENGAGKSTLMKILSGVYTPDEGTIEYLGEPLVLRGPQAAQAVGIAMIHQELNLVSHLSVAENIWLAREPRKGLFIDRAAQRAGALACLSRLGVAISPDALVSTLSVAQQQMVEIAKALSMKAELLIMDEPTSSLTDAETGQLFKVMHDLKRAGVGIVYISHRLDELAGIVDRVTVMRDGRHVSTKPFAQTSIDEIVSSMVGRPLDDKFPLATRQPTTETMLEVRGLRRQGAFGPLDFDLRRGEILGFAGLIGAGRTEVARAVFGADPVDAGSVRLEGRELRIRTPADAIREGFAYVSEDRKAHGLAVKMTVAQNITLANIGAVLRRRCLVAFDRELAAARRYIEALGIRTPSPHQVVQLLSGGNQQKVVIAKWLFRDSRVIFFDEPTRGIDVGAKFAIYELMDKLAAQGIGIVLISSELPEILGLTDRVAVFHEGRITRVLETRSTSQKEIMHYASVRRADAAPAAESTLSALAT